MVVIEAEQEQDDEKTDNMKQEKQINKPYLLNLSYNLKDNLKEISKNFCI